MPTNAHPSAARCPAPGAGNRLSCAHQRWLRGTASAGWRAVHRRSHAPRRDYNRAKRVAQTSALGPLLNKQSPSCAFQAGARLAHAAVADGIASHISRLGMFTTRQTIQNGTVRSRPLVYPAPLSVEPPRAPQRAAMVGSLQQCINRMRLIDSSVCCFHRTIAKVFEKPLVR